MTEKTEESQGASSLFYTKPVPLDRGDHANFKLVPIADIGYTFAKNAKAVYVTAIEFAEASKEYPIFFIKNDDKFTAMLGLSVDGETNAFVDGKEWNARYVPAFVRRYPFIPGLSSEEQENDKEQKFTLMVDANYEGFATDVNGVPLFEDGEVGTELAQITDFVRNYHDENAKTKTFVQTLIDLDLLVDKRLQITFPDGYTQFSIAGTWVVDEEKLKDLDEKKVSELHNSGYLYLIYMHLASLRNFSYLANIHTKKNA